MFILVGDLSQSKHPAACPAPLRAAAAAAASLNGFPSPAKEAFSPRGDLIKGSEWRSVTAAMLGVLGERFNQLSNLSVYAGTCCRNVGEANAAIRPRLRVTQESMSIQ